MVGEKKMASFIFDNVNMEYFDNMVKRLKREDNFIVHPRTKETIIGCTNNRHPPFKKRGHLAGFPAVTYHRQLNKQCGIKLTAVEIAMHSLTARTPDKIYIGKPTSQYKTVWYSKHKRRM